MLGRSNSKYKGLKMWKYYSKNNSTWIVVWQHHLLLHTLLPQSLHFAAKFISSFRLLNGVLQVATTNYLELSCEVGLVCLLCGGHPLCLGHRMCVGVVENERGWEGMLAGSDHEGFFVPHH